MSFNWTETDEIFYAEAKAETDWDFEDIQKMKSTTIKSPYKPVTQCTTQKPIKPTSDIRK